MSTAQDLPLAFGEPLGLPAGFPAVPDGHEVIDLDAPLARPLLRLVPELPAVPLDFDAAVRSVRPRLHRYATRRLGDVHEAEELVQEALLRAYSHRDKLQTEEDLAAWSTVVTGRLVIDRLRVRGRSVSVADVPESNRFGRVGRDTADVVVGRDEARTALDALDAMPGRQAALLWAREVEGDSYEDLCVRFGMTEPAVRSILTRARKSLRKEYATRGGTLPVGGLAVLAPWLAGLTWADRLRKAVHRVTAPAALATAGITALGGLVLAPFGAVGPQATTFTPHQAVVVSGAITPAVTHPVLSASSHLVAGAVTRTHAAVTTQPVPRAPETKLVDSADLPCTGRAVESARCAPGTKGAFVSLSPATPKNPVTHEKLGATVTDYDCTGWQANPVIACTPGGANR